MKNFKEEIKQTYKKQLNDVINDLKTPGKRKKQIPNLLTASRLFSPLIIIPAALVGNVGFAAAAAIGFGLTDFLDGKLARKWNAKSQFGADLDAITDKIFAGTLLLGGAIFNPLLLINVGLEALIAGINVNEKLAGKKPASTKTGKVKTGFIFGLGALGILAPALSLSPAILPGLALTTAALQGATIASYVKKYHPTNKKNAENAENSKKRSPIALEPTPEYHQKLEKTYEKNLEIPETVQTIDPALDRLVNQIIDQAEKQDSHSLDTPKELTKKTNN